MPFPGGGGQPTRAEEITNYAHLLNQSYPPSSIGANLGADYQKYMSQHPKDDPATIYNSVVSALNAYLSGGKGLGESIAQFIGAQGNLTQQIVKGVGKSLTDGGGSGQDWQHLLVRTGEFALGGILIAIGIAAILSKTKTAQTAVNVATGVSPGTRVTKRVANRPRPEGASRAGFTSGGIND